MDSWAAASIHRTPPLGQFHSRFQSRQFSILFGSTKRRHRFPRLWAITLSQSRTSLDRNRWPFRAAINDYGIKDGSSPPCRYQGAAAIVLVCYVTQRELRIYPMIHGETTAVRELTLIDCFERGVRGSFRGPSSREIYANRVIAGMQVSAPDPMIRSESAVFDKLTGTNLRRKYA